MIKTGRLSDSFILLMRYWLTVEGIVKSLLISESCIDQFSHK